MSTMKLIRYQACLIEFLLRFNFVIFYILDKKNQKADSLTCHLNDFPLDNNDNYQQHLL